MALAELQAALARLFTDEELRRAFLTAPEEAARTLDLSPKDAAAFAALDPRAVEDYAECLLRKRILDARKTLPLTARALGDAFDRLICPNIDGPPRAKRHRADACVFVDRLAREAARGEAQPLWIGDLARYEKAFIEMEAQSARCLLRLFRFPVGAIAQSLMLDAPPQDVAPRLTLGLWLRLGKGGRLRRWVV